MTSTLASPLPTTTETRGPFRLAIGLLVVTAVTILWGAMTTSTGSGLAYLDWPPSDGQLMPESSYTSLPHFLEHFHRLFGATAGLLSVWLVTWLVWGGVGNAAARRTAWFGLGLIITQGVIGGVGVLKGLPAVTSVTHGTLAQLTMATFAWLAYQLSPRYRDTRSLASSAAEPADGSVRVGAGRKLVLFALVVLVTQTVVGAVARHTNSTHALWTHVGNAFVVFVVGSIATAFAVGKLSKAPGIPTLSRTIVSLLVLQIVLGFVALAIRNAAGKTPENIANLGTALVISGHVLLGAFLTVLMATLAAHVFRATRRPDGDRVQERLP